MSAYIGNNAWDRSFFHLTSNGRFCGRIYCREEQLLRASSTLTVRLTEVSENICMQKPASCCNIRMLQLNNNITYCAWL